MTAATGNGSLYSVELCSYEHSAMAERLRRLMRAGCGISAVARVLTTAQLIAEGQDCEQCADFHADLTNAVTIDGLHAALDELGDLVYTLADQTSTLLESAAGKLEAERQQPTTSSTGARQ